MANEIMTNNYYWQNCKTKTLLITNPIYILLSYWNFVLGSTISEFVVHIHIKHVNIVLCRHRSHNVVYYAVLCAQNKKLPVPNLAVCIYNNLLRTRHNAIVDVLLTRNAIENVKHFEVSLATIRLFMKRAPTLFLKINTDEFLFRNN